jgi:hypothetical protein
MHGIFLLFCRERTVLKSTNIFEKTRLTYCVFDGRGKNMCDFGHLSSLVESNLTGQFRSARKQFVALFCLRDKRGFPVGKKIIYRIF